MAEPAAEDARAGPSTMDYLLAALPCFPSIEPQGKKVEKPPLRSAFAYDPLKQLKAELSMKAASDLRKRCEVVGLSKDEVEERNK